MCHRSTLAMPPATRSVSALRSLVHWMRLSDMCLGVISPCAKFVGARDAHAAAGDDGGVGGVGRYGNARVASRTAAVAMHGSLGCNNVIY